MVGLISGPPIFWLMLGTKELGSNDSKVEKNIFTVSRKEVVTQMLLSDNFNLSVGDNPSCQRKEL